MRRPLVAGLVALTTLMACEPEPAIDHYILALSWQPAFCEYNTGKAECRALDAQDFAAMNLTLHGLWPNAADGDHPFYCGVPADDRRADEAGDWCALPAPGTDQATQSALAEAMPGSHSCLDRHEWIKHGTCTGFGGDAYFDTALHLLQEVEATRLSNLLRANIGREISRRDLLQAWERDFGPGSADALEIVCRRDGQRTNLTEVRLALRRDALDKPLSPDTLFLDGPPPHGGCPARIYLDPAG
jgi:ribonuclease T2